MTRLAFLMWVFVARTQVFTLAWQAFYRRNHHPSAKKKIFLKEKVRGHLHLVWFRWTMDVLHINIFMFGFTPFSPQAHSVSRTQKETRTITINSPILVLCLLCSHSLKWMLFGDVILSQALSKHPPHNV